MKDILDDLLFIRQACCTTSSMIRSSTPRLKIVACSSSLLTRSQVPAIIALLHQSTCFLLLTHTEWSVSCAYDSTIRFQSCVGLVMAFERPLDEASVVRNHLTCKLRSTFLLLNTVWFDLPGLLTRKSRLRSVLMSFSHNLWEELVAVLPQYLSEPTTCLSYRDRLGENVFFSCIALCFVEQNTVHLYPSGARHLS